jgi:hypothetical protein
MHGELIVAIETEIGNRDFLGWDQLFGDGEPNKIVTLRTLTRAVFGHDALIKYRRWFLRVMGAEVKTICGRVQEFLVFI